MAVMSSSCCDDANPCALMSRNGVNNGATRKVTPTGAAPSARLTTLSRRRWIGIVLAGGATTLMGERWWRSANAGVLAVGETPITVYASPSCTCCHKWVQHLTDSDYHVTVVPSSDVVPMKRKLGVPDALWSCHTSVVAGYTVEGHVPADVLKKLLRDHPMIAGLAAPGMPQDSPGMDSGSKEPYDIVAFTLAGVTSVYATR